MKKLIYKNIISEILLFLFLSLFALTIIIWIIQAVNYLDLVSEDGHSFSIYFKFSLLSIPKILSRILIFVLFISIFYVISKYEDNNEILIFWTNGINKAQFINSVLIFSTIFVVLQLCLNSLIVPKSLDLGRKYIRTSGIELFPSLLKEKKFIDTVSDLTIFIDKKTNDGKLQKIFLKDKYDDDNSKIIIAREGQILKKNDNYYLNLENGRMLNLEKKNTNIIEFSESELNLSLYATKTTTFPKIQEISSEEILECLLSYYKKNKNYTKRNFVCNESSIQSVNKEFFRRFINPIYILLVAFIATSLVLKSKDEKNYSKFKYFIFILGITTIILSEVSAEYLNFDNIISSLLITIPFFFGLLVYFTLFKKAYNKIKI
tara:strand:+ start:37 stop:1164 length:1128 start_codon:yes stop_codon:yes gene_type:complete